jgi:hypothetical protein
VPVTYAEPFSGGTATTCSVSAAYAAKHAEGLKARGLTEAEWQKQKHLGTWGVIKGKLQAGTMEDVPFAMWSLSGKTWKIGAKNGEVVAYQIEGKFSSVIPLDNFEDFWVQSALKSGDWQWLGAHTPKKGAVPVTSTSPGALSDLDAATLFVKTKDEVAAAKGINIKGANPQLDLEVYMAIGNQTGYQWYEIRDKVLAYKASGKKLSSLKKKVVAKKADTVSPAFPPQPAVKVEPDPATDVQPTAFPKAVPVEAAEDVVESAAQQVIQATPEYLDEDVAKAYIKAKDQLAASPDNPWTLYTQNNSEFERAIYNTMSKEYGIDLPQSSIKKQLARYISEQKKLSVLKKQMAKTGEYVPQADTLKKKKGDPTGTGKVSKTQADKDIADAAAAGHHPGDPYRFTEQQEDAVFDALKNNLYAGMGDQAVYTSLENAAATLAKQFGVKAGDISVLDVVRVYDKKKSAQLGIENGFFYEKKAAAWAASPAGRAQILAKQQADELLKNLPGLPADSVTFQEVSVEKARQIRDDMLRGQDWTATQRKSLRHYTGGAYREMNFAQREGRFSTTYEKDNIIQAQRGMRPTTERLLTHRGCDFKQFGIGSFEQALQLVGKRVKDEGFLSTSVGGRAAFSGEVYLEIEVPEGTFAAFVKDISNFSHENEWLMAAGTEYDVLGVERKGYQTTIRIRAVPGSHTRY